MIDYEAAVPNGLRLGPDGTALELLVADYTGMIEERLVTHCRTIQAGSNRG